MFRVQVACRALQGGSIKRFSFCRHEPLIWVDDIGLDRSRQGLGPGMRGDVD